MATTEHTLSLKAVLDTRQVQQELQKLRQQSQALIGQPRQQGINSPTSAAANLGNLNGLGTAMTRLAQMIQHLDHTMSQMNAMSKQSMMQSKQSMPFAVNPLQAASSTAASIGVNAIQQAQLRALIGRGGTGSGKAYSFLRNLDERTFNKFLTERSDFLLGKKLGGQVGASLMQKNYAGYTLASNFIPEGMPYNAWSNWIGRNDVRDAIRKQLYPEDTATKARTFQNRRMAKFIGGMAMHQIGSSAAELAEATGHEGAAWGIQAASKVGGYTLMGALAGPGGAAIGAAAGAIESLFDLFIQKAREAENALQREWQIEQTLKRGTTSWRRSVDEYNKTTRFTNLIEDFNENKTAAGLLNLTKEQERLSQRRDFVAGRIETYQKMSEQGYLGESDIKGAEDMRRELQELDGKLKTLRNTIKNFNKALDNVKEADQYSEETRQLFKTGSLADIQARYDSIKQLRDVAAATGDIETFSKQNPRMRAYQQRIEMIQEIQARSATELSRMDESYANRLVADDYGIGGDRGVYSQMMNYARSSADLRKQYEQQMKEGRLEEAAKTKESWQFAAGERNMFADTLMQILGGRTADLTNVTSLAAMGLHMGETVDNVDRQMAVWKEQANLQREIKNILNEKTFTAAYGE